MEVVGGSTIFFYLGGLIFISALKIF